MQNDIRLDVHGLSRCGADHHRNHDHFVIADLNRSLRVHQTNLSLADDSRVVGRTQGHVFLVADGISGGPAPAAASSTAADSIVQTFLDDLPWPQLIDGPPREVTRALEGALSKAEEDLRARGNAPGMGTTLTLAFVAWPDLHIAHVGDSRCYLSRAGVLRQLTTDHTLSQVREQLGGEPGRGDENILWNAVGGTTASDLQAEVLHLELQVNDIVVLCTDGAIAAAAPGELNEVVHSGACAEDMAQRIVERDGSDDRTAIVVRCTPASAERVAAAVQLPTPTLHAARRDTPPSGSADAPVRPTPKAAV